MPPPKRAHGRSLADFGNLHPAEKILLEKCAIGAAATIGNGVPADGSDRFKIVRASFLRFLLLGGDEQAPVHEQGVQLFGAWIQGELNLENCHVPHRMALSECKFDEPIIAIDAHIAGLLFLSGSHLQKGLSADRLRCDGGVFLRRGFRSSDTVCVSGAQIGGNLDCSGGQFASETGYALSADGAVIKGYVFLHKGFKATGEVWLLGTQIGGNLECSGGQFEQKDGHSLCFDRSVINGNVHLNKQFRATGTVRLLGTQIGGNLDCSGGQFSAHGLIIQSATIQSNLFLRDIADPVSIDADSARIGVLEDAPTAWAKGSILNGLVYKSLAGIAHTDAAHRIAWLKKQRHEDLGEDKKKQGFRPQPWKQLQKVLCEMGHEADARLVGIAFEDQLRLADRIGQITDISKAQNIIPIVRRQCLRGLHWLFGTLAGYGYRPMRLFMSVVVVWLFCAAVYWCLSLPPYNAIGPTDPVVYQHAKYATCTDKEKGNWMLCEALPAEYSTLSPLAYSLDILLPLVDLGQEKSWGPLVPTPERHFCVELFTFSPAHWVRLLNWFEILYGWVASLLFVAIVSGMSRRSEMDK